jgi:hypothetical protein
VGSAQTIATWRPHVPSRVPAVCRDASSERQRRTSHFGPVTYGAKVSGVGTVRARAFVSQKVYIYGVVYVPVMVIMMCNVMVIMVCKGRGKRIPCQSLGNRQHHTVLPAWEWTVVVVALCGSCADIIVCLCFCVLLRSVAVDRGMCACASPDKDECACAARCAMCDVCRMAMTDGEIAEICVF